MQKKGQQDSSFIIQSYAVFIAIYFSMLGRLPLTIDAEYMAAQHKLTPWVIQGRWAIYLLERYIVPPPVTTYATLAIFGIAAAVAFWLILRACEIVPNWMHLFAFAVFCGFPIWATLLEFPANTPGTAAGLILASWAAYSISQNRQRQNFDRARMTATIGEVAAITFAIGCYQSFVFVFASIVLGISLFVKENRWRILLNGFLVSIIGLAAYSIINNLFLRFMGLNLAYIQGFVHLGYLAANPIHIISASLRDVFKIYTGSSEMLGISVWASALIVVAALAVVFSQSFVDGLLLIGLLLAPFPMLFVAGDLVPLRVLVAVPVSLSVCALLLLQSPQTFVRQAGVVICCLTGIQSMYAVSQYQTERDYVTRFETETAGLLYERIGEAGDLSKTQPVYFYGHLDSSQVLPTAYGSTAGGSFFAWDQGNPDRILDFMTLVGFAHNITLPSSQQKTAIFGSFAKMPAWPAKGSVRTDDGVVLVKLSDQPGYLEVPPTPSGG